MVCPRGIPKLFSGIVEWPKTLSQFGMPTKTNRIQKLIRKPFGIIVGEVTVEVPSMLTERTLKQIFV